LADVLVDEGDPRAAELLLAESLSLNVELGNRTNIAFVLDTLAAADAMQGRAERALRLAGAAAALRAAVDARRPPPEQARFDRLVEPARQTLGEERAASTWAEGRAMSLEQAIAYAMNGTD
jgi:hypothetical protein